MWASWRRVILCITEGEAPVPSRAKRLLGPAYNPSAGADAGTKFLIGDHVYITAAHVVYEYNMQNKSNPSAINLDDIVDHNSSSDTYTVLSDIRGYRAQYLGRAFPMQNWSRSSM